VQYVFRLEAIMKSDGLTGIEIRHLLALKAVAETSSFSRAAERLGYAQSAVSQQIAALEKVVGLRLVERPGGPRPVSLTEAGRVLTHHAEHIMARLGAARADLDALAAGAAGTVRVGTFQSAGARILPAVLARFRAEWPSVRVELLERNDDDALMALVAAGQVDLTFGTVDSAVHVGCEHVSLLEDPYVLLTPPGSVYAERDSVDPAELDGEDVIGFNDDGTCKLLLSDLWRRAGASPKIVFRTDDNLTLQRLVGAGLGHAIVPELTVETGNTDDAAAAVVVALSGTTAARHIALFWRSDRYHSAAAQAFVETTAAVCRAQGHRPAETPLR
jgi:DNA-binding transcriptional LysR family regulator